MQFDNLMILILILYVFLIPLYVSYSSILERHHLGNLLFFDIMFMASKIVDLFIGYYTKEGPLEPRFPMVLMRNLTNSNDFLMEIVYTFGPFFFDLNNLNSIYYFLFKFPRFNNLFMMAMKINKTINYYGKSLTVFEIKNIVKRFDILQFFIQTCNILHLLTCT